MVELPTEDVPKLRSYLDASVVSPLNLDFMVFSWKRGILMLIEISLLFAKFDRRGTS